MRILTYLDNILSCQTFAKTHLLKQYLHPIANREEFGLSKEDLAYQKTNGYQIRDVQNEILFSKKSDSDSVLYTSQYGTLGSSYV